MIPYGKHFLDDDDISAVVDVLQNGFITQGPKISELEQKIVKYTGAKYAVAVSSATAALHLASIAIGLKSKDLVYTSANTFVRNSKCNTLCRRCSSVLRHRSTQS